MGKQILRHAHDWLPVSGYAYDVHGQRSPNIVGPTLQAKLFDVQQI